MWICKGRKCAYVLGIDNNHRALDSYAANKNTAIPFLEMHAINMCDRDSDPSMEAAKPDDMVMITKNNIVVKAEGGSERTTTRSQNDEEVVRWGFVFVDCKFTGTEIHRSGSFDK